MEWHLWPHSLIAIFKERVTGNNECITVILTPADMCRGILASEGPKGELVCTKCHHSLGLWSDVLTVERRIN